MKKAALLACAGLPERQTTEDGLEFLVYTASSHILRTRSCQATFLKHGVVQSVTYQGRTGGFLSQDEQCALIVESCLKK
jgi:hypothetical protein